MSELPTGRLVIGSPEERETAARALQERAATRPADLHDSLERIAEGLRDERETVRRSVASALFEVAVDDPAAVAPVAEALVDGLDDQSTAVRVGVARPIAELATVRPQRLRFGIAGLTPYLTDVKGVRRCIARALAALSVRYPEALHEHVDALTRAALDDYYPVQVHVLRTLARLERNYEGVLAVVDDRVLELLDAEQPAVRQAACHAVAAADLDRGRTVLTDVCRTDPHPVVRETAKGALTRLSPTGTTPRNLPDDELFAAVGYGTWLAVRSDRHEEWFVGRVTAASRERSAADAEAARSRGLRREDFATREEWLAAPRIEPSGDRTAVHLHDPFRREGINLVRLEGTIGGEHTTPDERVPTLFRPTELRPVSADLAHLLAARSGDELAFELEGATHVIEVTAADDRDGVYRVEGENAERGYRISFRPFSNDPLMAVFEKGRAFEASNFSLSNVD